MFKKIPGGGAPGTQSAAAERLTRSAAKLEAEMRTLSGLLGEEDDHRHEERNASDVTVQKLLDENQALRGIMRNVMPYARLYQSDELPREGPEPGAARSGVPGSPPTPPTPPSVPSVPSVPPCPSGSILKPWPWQ